MDEILSAIAMAQAQGIAAMAIVEALIEEMAETDPNLPKRIFDRSNQIADEFIATTEGAVGGHARALLERLVSI